MANRAKNDYETGKNLNARVREIFIPLFTIADEYKDLILDYATEIDADIKDELIDSLAGDTLKAILELLSEGKNEIHSGNIAEKVVRITGDHELNPQRIGKVLKRDLYLKTKSNGRTDQKSPVQDRPDRSSIG